MTKRSKLIYWIATVWLALGMVSTGLVQLLQIEEQVRPTVDMGYPLFFLCMLGAAKILGSIVILIPRFPLLKEWAYAGFAFAMIGAVISHLAANTNINEIFPPLLLLALTFISWYFRPTDRRLG